LNKYKKAIAFCNGFFVKYLLITIKKEDEVFRRKNLSVFDDRLCWTIQYSL